MIEVEIKIQIQNPERIKELFDNENGTYQFSLLHEDTYYNMPTELRDFKKSDEALRVRKSEKFNKKQQEKKTEHYYITYKGAKLDSKTKTRRELETLVKDGEILKNILDALGFREVLTVKKERELYKFMYKDKSIEVLLDYLPILDQFFIEAELLVESETKINQARDLLFSFLKCFNIKQSDSIRKSYLELIIENLKLDV